MNAVGLVDDVMTLLHAGRVSSVVLPVVGRGGE